MPIQTGDVKLLKSAVMADVPEGGGAPTGNTIADGVSNAIFPDISELDRAGGRVNLRKTFVSVQTDDTDTYFGANVIVAEPPKDARVSVTLFSTERTFDNREQAQLRIEAYLNKGPEWAGYLFENHIAGQRVIQLFQRPTDTVPNVGQTLVLVESEGQATQKEQYVRATAVSVVERTFTYDGDKDYKAAVVTVDISDALRYDFTGSPASRTFTRAANGTKVRDTVVADAGTYVGVVPLTQAAAVGDFTIKGASIYTQLVPSAQTETPISFVPPYAAAGLPVPGASSVSYTANHAWTPGLRFNLPGGCLPGSLTLQTDGITIFDDAGLLKTASGTIGTIDYANGILALNAGSMSNAKAVTYTPAAQILRAPQSSEIPVTPESRSQSYVGTVTPVPQPGTLSISYMAQGRWYVLSDAGNGTLKGLDASYGAGTVNRNTGAFVVTLGALPDVGSSLILTWNVPTQETQQPQVTLKASQTLVLSPPEGKAVQPGSLTVSWEYTGTKTATAATNGVLSGAATGVLRIASNRLEFAPNVLPSVGTQLTVSYVAGPKQEDAFAHPSRNGSGLVPVTATLGSIEPGSLEVEWNTLTDTSVLGAYTLAQLLEMGVQAAWRDPTQIARDDGNGHVVLNGSSIGTVDYATGQVTFNPDVTVLIPRPLYTSTAINGTGRWRLNYRGLAYVEAPSLYPNDESGYVKLRYNSAGSTSSVTETFQFTPSFKLVPGVNAQIVPGTVVLTLPGAQPWGDNGQGTLREFTSSGWVTRGTINYLSGDVTLTSWTAGTTNAFTRASCVTTVGENISSEYVFRTGAAPLRPGSLSIQYARAVGGTQTVTAGIDGKIQATGITGSVDYENGLVRVRFGSFVTAAGNESEPWYSADRVGSDGKIFRPEPVAASTVRYSAVAYSYLPLDADLLGIDPVRLPSDGRVPIFRAGGFAVVGHTGKITAPVANGQTINCGRVRLSRVRVVGHDGTVIHSGYTTDLEAGTVSFNNVTGYSQPVTIEHRIEDMAVVRDVQINGEISFTRALTHEYPVATAGDPASGSYVSSALIAGDLFARVSLVFDQATWNGAWVDAMSGSAATATFNNTQYPIRVTNRGAVTERWVVRFTNSTAFEVIGENVGVIATGNTSADCAPNNPATGVPYFHLPALGWGSGWATGNVLRFNTIGAQFPVWVVRTVQQGPESVPNDNFTLLIRGDVDTP
ncbi:conserved hypothetical protein [Methylococcus capsulatus str. Bath]|uniref:Uncharacterized protein n=1 Tax=Methylococcus capsulatus (strain ATCC 33009 / NCIMB 11132 / Bath) TaxID=243233 RepID=Q603X4_METCA|nr:hypothetical protein [Methylococcus capsulatus]AAU91174.1 conserved hypothetical protein [Methylococcus capsulatus str. Bath]